MQSRMTWRCNGSTVGVEYSTACLLINHNDGAFLFTFKDKDTLTTAVPKRCDNTQPSTSWLIFHPQSRRIPVSALHPPLFPPLSSPRAGELFAQAPIDEFPGIAVETVSDSSRYFVLRIQDDSGTSACVASRRVASREGLAGGSHRMWMLRDCGIAIWCFWSYG